VGEDPVAEPPPRFVEAPKGQRTDGAVHGQAALLLEGAYGELDASVELRSLAELVEVTGCAVVQQTDPLEQTGDLGDGGTRVPEPEDRVHAGETRPWMMLPDFATLTR
jgi:hypothetical protein